MHVLISTCVLGIIPACAGSTRRPFTAVSVSRDHPRMRGEHAQPWAPSTMAQGSSPHARGAQYLTCNPVEPTIPDSFTFMKEVAR